MSGSSSPLRRLPPHSRGWDAASAGGAGSGSSSSRDGATMGSSPPSERLTPLQKAVLRAFFARERGFHLTGGAALAGYYLGHRRTDDLDLFALDDAPFERGRHVLA